MASKKRTNQNKNMNASPKDQLTALLPSLSVKTPFGTKLPINAGQWKTEGFDHINISRFSTEQLGRQMDFDTVRVFDHPKLGSFKSMNALWHFIRAKQPNDHIRMLFGNVLRNFVQRECGGFIPVLNFRAIVMHSAYLRVKADRGLTKLLVESTLPFDCYRTIKDSGIRMRFEHTNWLVGGYEEIRAALKEKREPNFESLMDKKSDDIYADLIRRLAPDTDPNPDMPVVREKADTNVKPALVAPKSYDVVDIDSSQSNEKSDVAEAAPSVADTATAVPSVVVVVDPAVDAPDQSTTVTVADIAEALEGRFYPASADDIEQAAQAAEAVVALPVEPPAADELLVPSDLIQDVVTQDHIAEAHRLVAEEIQNESVEEAPPVESMEPTTAPVEEVLPLAASACEESNDVSMLKMADSGLAPAASLVV